MPHTPPSALPTSGQPTLQCDVLVLGSGAGGLSLAVTAAHMGLQVIVAEKEAQFGGTTAWSGGWMWVPRNPLAREAGIEEPPEAPLAYLRRELGAQFDEGMARAYLDNAPLMVDFFRQHTALQFIDGNAIADFHDHNPYAAKGGRSVCAAPFDGRRLGPHLQQLKPPLYETTLWGMGIASGAELRHFFNARRHWRSLLYVGKKLLRHACDLLLHRRSTQLVNGNALVAALARSLFDAGGQIWLRHPATQLLTQGERVTGAVLRGPQGEQAVHARCAVVLACGGFAHDRQRKQALLAHAPTGAEHWSAAARGNTGDGLHLAQRVGGQIAQAGQLAQAAALAPVSLVPYSFGAAKAGYKTHFAHLIERGKPGLIAVTAHGKRFANEADSYHDFMQALLAACPAPQTPQAWLLCDHRFIRHFGLGAVKPAPLPLRPWLRNGYLRRGQTLAELARRCGIDADALKSTVLRYNAMCLIGEDRDFGKGQSAYNRAQGDADCAARWTDSLDGSVNPCMAPLTRGPYYAVKVVMGSLGTFAGVRVNAQAQVLNAQQQAIAGLYACGNDMNSVMGGHYPAGGITLGPAMTFGFVAAQHIAAQHAKNPATP